LENRIKVISQAFLKGPNRWGYRPVLESLIDIGDFENYPSNLIPGFYERLLKILPKLSEHGCSYGVPGGFLRRLEEGTYAGHIIKHLALELQSMVADTKCFGRAREIEKVGVYHVIFSAEHEETAKKILSAAIDLFHAAAFNYEFSLKERLDEIQDLADQYYLGCGTRSIVEALRKRDVPAIRLSDGSLVQLNYGAYQQKILSTETSKTNVVSSDISCDKHLSKKMLHDVGIRTPLGLTAANKDEAWQRAQDVGLPVAVKPNFSHNGRGVSLNLTTQSQVEEAFDMAIQVKGEVIVERYIKGTEYRLLVVDGKMVAALEGRDEYVTGDGQHTIWELIEQQINTDPRRGKGFNVPYYPIENDPDLKKILAKGSRSPESILAKGEMVLIYQGPNLYRECTEEVHQDFVRAAILATKTIGLDIAGIDMIAENIRLPSKENNWAVLEVNAMPALTPHLKPGDGKVIPVGEIIADYLFPESRVCDSKASSKKALQRIPIVGITSSKPSPDLAKKIADIFYANGHKTGLACADGVYYNQKLMKNGAIEFNDARKILMHPRVTAAVFENNYRQHLREGTPYEYCHIAIVANINNDDHIGWDHIFNEEQLISVIKTQVDLVLKEGCAILDAENNLVAELAQFCKGDVIMVARDKNNPAILNAAEAGRRSVYLDGGQITGAIGEEVIFKQPCDQRALSEGSSGESLIKDQMIIATANWFLQDKLLLSQERTLSGANSGKEFLKKDVA